MFLLLVFINIYDGNQGQNRTADTGIFRPEWRFPASLLSITYAHRPRAKLPQVDRSGHEMTGVGHDMVTLLKATCVAQLNLRNLALLPRLPHIIVKLHAGPHLCPAAMLHTEPIFDL